MSWEIAAGVIALMGFAGSIATWVSKLSKTLAVLETTINTLNKVIDEFRKNNHDTHRELFGRIGEHDCIIENHEGRLIALEKSERKNKHE